MSNLDLRNIEKLPIDFEEIMEGLTNRIKTNLPNKWKDFLASNFGVELLEAFAYEATLMFYYNNMSVNECFLPTAKTRTAVYNHAKSMGYKPSPATQSSVTLKFYLENTHINNILIPKYTRCSTGDINFYTTENAVLYSDELYVTVPAKSGNINTDTFISNGIAGYKYKLINNNVNKIESVFVDDVEYEYVEFIDEQNNEAMYYTVDYDSDYYAFIKFGDGVYGKNPAKNLKIDVTYITGADITHNVNPYTINIINDVIYDSTNAIINGINVTNDEYANGASEAESLDEIKKNTPTVYKTQKRCVTKEDYEDTALMINGVNKVKILDNEMMSEIGIFGVKICVIPDTPSSGGYPSEAFKKDILKIFDDKKVCATQVDIIDPSYITLNTTVNVKISPTTNASTVMNKIRTNISKYLKWENRELGEAVTKQDIYGLVADVPGVLSIENIDISEQRYIYVLETPVIGSNTIKIRDTMSVLNEGSTINIMNIDGISALTAKIKTMDNEGTCTLSSLSDNSDIIITDEMNIAANCWVYPILKTKGSYNFGEKMITIQGDTLINSSIEKRTTLLSNINYTTIYFGDDQTKTYQILFRVGDSLYLDRGLEDNIDNNTDIVVMHKKFIPILSSTAVMGSSVLELTSYPRFGVGAKLLRYETALYNDTTLSVFRSSGGVDYLENYIAIDTLVKINKVYLNANMILTEGLDYTITNNSIINWTDIGKVKVPSNVQYYIDVTKKTDPHNVKVLDYYVKGINKKTINISPSLDSTLADGTSFDYTTDTFNILPWEIADCGTITINVEV